MFDFLKTIKNCLKTKETELPTSSSTVLDVKTIASSGTDTKKKEPIKDISIINFTLNPNVYVVNKAARLCVGKGELDDYESRVKHITMLTKRGHESVLEHSNIIGMIRINEVTICDFGIDLVNDLTEMLNKSRYLHTISKHKDGYLNILVGGSIRAYIHAIRETSKENMLIGNLKHILIDVTEKAFLQSLIDSGFVDEEECVYEPPTNIEYQDYVNEKGEIDQEAVAKPIDDPVTIYGENVDLIYSQDPLEIYNKISSYGFSIYDALEVCTVTFLFHGVSRAIGNQLVRHRAGITQESQRYCEHNTDKTKDFVDPILLHQKYKTGRYNDNPEYDDRIESEYLKKRNPFTVYNYMIKNKIKKEDARAWLPMNVTTKLIMTFTYKGYAKFYQLRSEKGAQFEIQLLAHQTFDLLKRAHGIFAQQDILKELIVNALIPEGIRNDISKTTKFDENLQQFIQEVKIDEIDNNISTEVQEVETPTKAEDIKSLDIDSIEDAEKYLKMTEEMKQL